MMCRLIVLAVLALAGYRMWGCGDNEIYHTGFHAKSQAGMPVAGVVCQGPYKAATIRFD
jgi:hypothetical protein